MKKIVLSTVLLVVLLGTSVAYALETNTYNFVASSSDTIIPVTTYRDGKIVASATYKPSNHGVYTLQIQNSLGYIMCWQTYDFRWGRTNPMPMICDTDEYSNPSVPAGTYYVYFRAVMGSKVSVTLNIAAETNP